MNIETPKGWRKGQTIFNFLWWLNTNGHSRPEVGGERMADPFHIPDKELDALFALFIETMR